MRPIQSDLVRTKSFRRPLAILVAAAVGSIGGATVILSLASPPITERSSYAVKPETATASLRPELQPALASATPTANMARGKVNAATPVQTMHKLGVPTNPKVRRVVTRGRHYHHNFARYFAPRFSSSW